MSIKQLTVFSLTFVSLSLCSVVFIGATAMVDGFERMAEAIKSYRQPPVPPTVDLVKLVKDG